MVFAISQAGDGPEHAVPDTAAVQSGRRARHEVLLEPEAGIVGDADHHQRLLFLDLEDAGGLVGVAGRPASSHNPRGAANAIQLGSPRRASEYDVLYGRNVDGDVIGHVGAEGRVQ